MSKLNEVFKSVCATLHWGPSVEPFHKAVIEEHDALEARVFALETKMSSMDEMLTMYETTKQEHEMLTAALQDPAYIDPPIPVLAEPVETNIPTAPESLVEAVDALAERVDAPAVVAEPVAAADADKAVDLQASHDAPAAAPDTPADPDVTTE